LTQFCLDLKLISDDGNQGSRNEGTCSCAFSKPQYWYQSENWEDLSWSIIVTAKQNVTDEEWQKKKAEPEDDGPKAEAQPEAKRPNPTGEVRTDLSQITFPAALSAEASYTKLWDNDQIVKILTPGCNIGGVCNCAGCPFSGEMLVFQIGFCSNINVNTFSSKLHCPHCKILIVPKSFIHYATKYKVSMIDSSGNTSEISGDQNLNGNAAYEWFSMINWTDKSQTITYTPLG